MHCMALGGIITMFRPLRSRTFWSLSLSLISIPLFAQAPPEDIVAKIRDEGLNRSQAMKTLSYLTDVIGPRLTGSPGMKWANEWTRDTMTSWGFENGHLEAWGPFGRGWTLERFSAQIVSPQCIPVIAYPKAWSPGVRGTLTGEVVYVDAATEADLEKYKGKLKGAIVLNGAMREVRARFEPLGTRHTDESLQRLESGQGGRGGGPGTGGPGGAGGRRRPGGGAGTETVPPGSGIHDHEDEQPPNFRANQQLAARKVAFFQEEGVAMLVDPSRNGDGGTLFVQSASVPTVKVNGQDKRYSAWDKDVPKILPQMVMAIEDYNRLVRMLQQGAKPKMAVQLGVRFHDKDLMAYNTIAEIPGTDKKEEVVMLGGHLDSWHSSTGATDNAVGCTVAMEAARILKAIGVKPRRTIRVALWSGEEQGLFGSRAYVEQHFSALEQPSASETRGDNTQPAPRRRINKPAYEKFSAYYNLDNGTGKIRGIYAQGNEAVMPLFKDWLAPFKDLGATTVTRSNTGSTDHIPFDSAGLPGFQFIQDAVEYSTRTHHSNQDNYDRIQADDVKQAAIIMATFVYQTAMRDELLPRKQTRTASAATP